MFSPCLFEDLECYKKNTHNPFFCTLIYLLHLTTTVVSKQLVPKSMRIQSSRHKLCCVTLVTEIIPLPVAEGISFPGKKPLLHFYDWLTRLLPCTGASRTASWLFETWFAAAGGGRDGHSSVHSREGRDGNVTRFTTALWSCCRYRLGVWGSNRDVRSMAREETESQRGGIK